MASSQPQERTSSSTPVFLLGIDSNRFGEKGAPEGEYGSVKPWYRRSLDLLRGAESVSTGAL
jgi:hypothetical protein